MRRLSRQTFRTGATPGGVGALLVAQLLLLRALASADTERVFVMGRELRWGCLFRRAFGLPCPACGMTRGVLLTLHGHFGDALRLNPAAVVLTLGVVLFAAALVFVAVHQRAHDPRSSGRLHARLRLAARAYAGLLFAVMLAHWVIEVMTRIAETGR
ncbi:MAG: DUF2752 domain-containing protein [Acidobacteria bacterium]|nr:DUF2752 domain-containing protein [Acidobacteriota bacterium]MCA1642962.1 DUF2752 domain-containing protein [Acidobacteriota bacterium]